ncbi:MAG: NHLP bacteriocin export ABC transporter permease/ATPase subunit [Deltaproteobacteria bacterium]|nr:NHLP bacteriocin export ABC transporter permease/ATPase subunit [Deltaproteobacteria bacterium]
MPGSWEQHRTVVEERSKAEVGTIFTQAGEIRDIDGSHTLVLDDPGRAFYVEGGAVDLFLVRVAEGQPVGRRQHFVRFEKGELFIGTDVLSSRRLGESYALVAVGTSNTRLRVMELAKLRQVAPGFSAADAVNGLLDMWVRTCSEGLTREAKPEGLVPLEPGTRETLPPGTRATSGQKTVWFHLISGTAKLVGLADLVPGEKVQLLPLTRASWIEATEEISLRLVDSGTLFKSDKEGASIRHFIRAMMTCLIVADQSDQKEELRRLEWKAETEDRVLSQALRALAVTSKEAAVPIAETPTDALYLAVAKVAEVNGIKISPLPKGIPITLENLARSNRFRTRQVVLGHRFYETAATPILGYAGKHPVALIPRTRSGFDIFDPRTGSKEGRKVDPEISQLLRPHGYVFYRPFPPRKLTALDLVRFGLGGNYADLALMLLASVLLGVLGMVGPFALGEIIDAVIPSADLGGLLQVTLVLLVVALSTFLAQIVRGLTAFRVETRATAQVQGAVWDRLLALPVPFFRSYTPGDLAMRANGIDAIRRALSGSTLQSLLTGMFSMMNFSLLLHYDSSLAGLAVAIAAAGVGLAVAVGLSTVTKQRRLEEMEGKLSSLVLETLTGIAKLRVAGAENRAFARWAAKFAEKRELVYRIQRLENGFSVVDGAFPVVSNVLIFSMVAASLPAEGGSGLTTGEFVGFNAAFGTFLGGLLSVVNTGIHLLDVLPTWERSKPLLESIPEVDDVKTHPGRLQGDIQVSGVSFRYGDSGPMILNDVSFNIKKGEMVAIVGGSGAGKSTLLRILLGFEKSTSGGVYYDGKDLSGLDVTEVRRQLGVVLQNGELTAGDIFTNIVGSRPLTLGDAMEAVKMAGLDEDIAHMPMGMHTVVGHGGKNLSGGQRQRVLIARAIVTRPKIIFFDEATSALDSKTQAVVSESLERLSATRVVIAHRLSTIRNADWIVVMDKGRVAQSGTYDALMEQEGLFRELASRQIA